MQLRERFNSLSHFVGAFLSLIGGIVLITKSMSSRVNLIASIIYSLSLTLLYLASGFYHGTQAKEEVIARLRKLDHTMIYVLIAGTYTPVCLVTLGDKLGYIMLSIIWGLAILGIILKFLWLNAPRKLYTGFYLILGWMAIFFFFPLQRAMDIRGIILLFGGGVAYSLGAFIYARKKTFLSFTGLGFHEIFHVFILIGSLLHYLMINIYVL